MTTQYACLPVLPSQNLSIHHGNAANARSQSEHHDISFTLRSPDVAFTK
jgi:hypothetical protein